MPQFSYYSYLPKVPETVVRMFDGLSQSDNPGVNDLVEGKTMPNNPNRELVPHVIFY